MQSLGWYTKRLGSMSPGEIMWRTSSALRDISDRWMMPVRQRRQIPAGVEGISTDDYEGGFRVTSRESGSGVTGVPGSVDECGDSELIARADRIAAGRLSFFDLDDVYVGDPVQWNIDHKTGKKTPLRFAGSIDYRDIRQAGDCKFVWEPNRHHHLVILARAYRATGRRCYAEALVRQLDSWLKQCPYGKGMNWRSPLELGIRLINWVWALDLIRPSGLPDSETYRRILESVYLHIDEITRKYSRGSSANNHLVGEAAGVFVATSYFTGMKHGERWQDESWDILCRELIRQTYDDGCTREHAMGYHVFVMQFYVISMWVARAVGYSIPESYRSRLRQMALFADAMDAAAPGSPLFGDADDGYVLDLGPDPRRVGSWVPVIMTLLDDIEQGSSSGGDSATSSLLDGLGSAADVTSVYDERRGDRLVSQGFSDSGYYLLQYGRRSDDEHISVGFDCGELGYGSIAAHGHADALSVTLRAGGHDIFVDPGTYDYFSYGPWREYFRSTRAHTTAEVDGCDQSQIQGLFMWSSHAKSQLLRWEPTEHGGMVMGEHNGYTRLRDPVVHQRMVELEGPSGTVRIEDCFRALKCHDIALYFHLGPACRVESQDGPLWTISCGDMTVLLEMDERLAVEAITGSDNPICGWFSGGYHRKQPITTVVCRCMCEGLSTLVTTVKVSGLTQ